MILIDIRQCKIFYNESKVYCIVIDGVKNIKEVLSNSAIVLF